MERSAMQMTAVYACVRILSEAIAGLQLHVYSYEDDGRRSKALDPSLHVLLHDEPNPEMTSFVFRNIDASKSRVGTGNIDSVLAQLVNEPVTADQVVDVYQFADEQYRHESDAGNRDSQRPHRILLQHDS